MKNVNKNITVKYFIDVFNCLLVAAIVSDKIFCCHGGMSPDFNSLEQINSLKRPTDVFSNSVLCDLLWSDPDKKIFEWDENKTFGEKVLNEFMSKYNFDLVCRSHQMVQEGYEFFAKRKLLTLFSAPCFANNSNSGAVLSVDEKLVCSVQVRK